MTYYLKKCGKQELGSIGADGKPQRGRYLLTSKHVLDYFPPLSQTQLNDSAIIPIVPLYLNQKIYCNYVYHNDKYNGSTANSPRDEYRIYLNKSLENNTLLFETNDIVVFRKHTELPESDDEEPQTLYFLEHVKNNGTALYEKLNACIENSEIHGGYAMYEGNIPELEEKVNSYLGAGQIDVQIDDTVTNRVEKFGNEDGGSIDSLFNSVSFRDFVMVGYGNLCAVTGTVIRYNSYMNLEAAHIKPRSHGGTYQPNNGLALCRDIHWAFDKGFFTITDDYKVKVHPNTTSDYLMSFDGKPIKLPTNQFFVPDLNNLHYHQKNVYGLFLTTGRL